MEQDFVVGCGDKRGVDVVVGFDCFCALFFEVCQFIDFDVVL